MSPFSKRFSHRPNDDGTYDSICPVCAATVARGMGESLLPAAELRHKCPGLPPSLAVKIEQHPK